MRYQDAIGHIERGNLSPLYLLYGEEDFLIEDIANRLIKRAVLPGTESFNFNTFYGSELQDITEVLNIANTLPMMAPTRLVIVRETDRIKTSNLEVLLSYLENPSPSTCLLFIAQKIDKRMRFYSRLIEKGIEIICYPLKEDQLSHWIRHRVESFDLRITDDAIEYLIEWVGGGLRSLDNELNKLKAYIGERKKIQLEDTQTVTGGLRLYSIFELLASIGRKEINRALKILLKIIKDGEHPLVVLSMISRQCRNLLIIKDGMSKKVPQTEIAREVGLPPKYFQPLLRQADNFTLQQLERSLHLFFQTDLDIKSGRGAVQNPLELLVIEMCKSPIPTHFR